MLQRPLGPQPVRNTLNLPQLLRQQMEFEAEQARCRQQELEAEQARLQTTYARRKQELEADQSHRHQQELEAEQEAQVVRGNVKLPCAIPF